MNTFSTIIIIIFGIPGNIIYVIIRNPAADDGALTRARVTHAMLLFEFNLFLQFRFTLARALSHPTYAHPKRIAHTVTASKVSVRNTSVYDDDDDEPYVTLNNTEAFSVGLNVLSFVLGGGNDRRVGRI